MRQPNGALGLHYALFIQEKEACREFSWNCKFDSMPIAWRESLKYNVEALYQVRSNDLVKMAPLGQSDLH